MPACQLCFPQRTYNSQIAYDKEHIYNSSCLQVPSDYLVAVCQLSFPQRTYRYNAHISAHDKEHTCNRSSYKSLLTALLLSVNFLFHERHTDTTHIYLYPHMTKNTHVTARAYKSLLRSLSQSVTEAELVTYASNVSVYVCVCVGVSVSVCVYDRGGSCDSHASNVSVYVCMCVCVCVYI